MPTIRRGAVGTAPLLGLALSFAAAPEWSQEAGLDVWNIPAARQELLLATQQRAEVEAHGEREARRRAAAHGVAVRLAGGMALAEATDELMELFGGDPGMSISLPALYPGAPTRRHAFALHAIDRVRRACENDPARRGAALARLEAEYARLDRSPESPRQ